MTHHKTLGPSLALAVLALVGSPAAAAPLAPGGAACLMSGMQPGARQPGTMQTGMGQAGMMRRGMGMMPGMQMQRMRMQRMRLRGMQPGGMGGMHPGMMGHGMMGHGMMGGGDARGGMQPGMGGNMADMQQIHTLLANHDAIRRTVRLLPNGVETVTTSPDPRIAALLPQHVEAMYARLKEGRLIRGFDPLFVELFRQAGKIDLKLEKLDSGVRVVETSTDPYAVRLIQAHARAVDGFVKDGMGAMHRTHPVPTPPAAERH